MYVCMCVITSEEKKDKQGTYGQEINEENDSQWGHDAWNNRDKYQRKRTGQRDTYSGSFARRVRWSSDQWEEPNAPNDPARCLRLALFESL